MPSFVADFVIDVLGVKVAESVPSFAADSSGVKVAEPSVSDPNNSVGMGAFSRLLLFTIAFSMRLFISDSV